MTASIMTMTMREIITMIATITTKLTNYKTPLE